MKLLCIILLCCTLNGWAQSNTPIELSARLLNAVNAQQPTAPLLQQISDLDAATLPQLLPTDQHKMAFWINLYNAFAQIRLQSDTNLLHQPRTFWKDGKFKVAGKPLSLQLIYHGLLRHSKRAGHGGEKSKWFISKFEKTNRVEKVNPQLHFAINQGNADGPMIFVYNENNIDRLLNLATTSFLQKLNTGNQPYLVLPQFMQTFQFDFEKGSNTLTFVQNNGITKVQAALPIQFTTPSFVTRLNNFWLD